MGKVCMNQIAYTRTVIYLFFLSFQLFCKFVLLEFLSSNTKLKECFVQNWPQFWSSIVVQGSFVDV